MATGEGIPTPDRTIRAGQREKLLEGEWDKVSRVYVEPPTGAPYISIRDEGGAETSRREPTSEEMTTAVSIPGEGEPRSRFIHPSGDPPAVDPVTVETNVFDKIFNGTSYREVRAPDGRMSAQVLMRKSDGTTRPGPQIPPGGKWGFDGRGRPLHEWTGTEWIPETVTVPPAPATAPPAAALAPAVPVVTPPHATPPTTPDPPGLSTLSRTPLPGGATPGVLAAPGTPPGPTPAADSAELDRLNARIRDIETQHATERTAWVTERDALRNDISTLRTEVAAAARALAERDAARTHPPATERTLRTIDMIIRQQREKAGGTWKYLKSYIFSRDFVYTMAACAATGALVSLTAGATLGLGGVWAAALAGSASGAVRGVFERNKARKILDKEIADARAHGDTAEITRLELESQMISKDAYAHGFRTSVLGAVFGSIGYLGMEYSGGREMINSKLSSFSSFLLGTSAGASGAKLASTVPPPSGARLLAPEYARPYAPRPPAAPWDVHARALRMRCVPEEIFYQRFQSRPCPPFFEPYACRMRVPGTQIIECFPARGPRVGPFVYDVFPGPRAGNNVWSFMHHTLEGNIRGPRSQVVTQYYLDELMRKNPNYIRSLGIESGRPSLIGHTPGQRIDLRKLFADEEVLRSVLRRPRLSPAEQNGLFRTYYEANMSLGKRPPLVREINEMWANNPQMRGRNFIPRR